METLTRTKWAVDTAHSEVGFKVRHMMISTVKGHFDEFEADLYTNGDDISTAEVNVKINTASVNTKNKDRDAHLRSDDFFNAEEFPQMTFVSKSYDGEKMIGDLTIREITKEVELDVEFNGIVQDPYGRTKAGFEISGTILRKEFGLKWDAITEAGSVVVSDNVTLSIDAQFIMQGE